jgi:peptidoglycan hydrolase-like protein with peptidoglycan-binding domain
MTDIIAVGHARRPGRLRRTVAGAVSVALLGSTALAVWFAVTAKPRSAGNPASVPTTTAAVSRGTATQRIRIPGTYGFDGAYTVVHQAPPGILTGAADAGTRVERGGVLYAVDNQAVRLLYGRLPAYRDFRAGMTGGPDVRQLEQNLVHLGLDPLRQITVDNRFTAATGAAIRRWQASWGLPAARRTGILSLGQVVFLPVALRVNEVTAAVGTAVGPNEPVLAASSTARVVTAQVGADRQAFVEVGDEVMVSLPGASPVPGKVLQTGRVANVGEQTDNGRPPGPATITVTIGITVPNGTRDLDQAPVLVDIASSVRKNVLLVPVAALLARPGGGYQVRLASGDYLEVRPGLFDEATGKVEVSGELKVGDLVEVPVT